MIDGLLGLVKQHVSRPLDRIMQGSDDFLGYERTADKMPSNADIQSMLSKLQNENIMSDTREKKRQLIQHADHMILALEKGLDHMLHLTRKNPQAKFGNSAEHSRFMSMTKEHRNIIALVSRLCSARNKLASSYPSGVLCIQSWESYELGQIQQYQARNRASFAPKGPEQDPTNTGQQTERLYAFC